MNVETIAAGRLHRDGVLRGILFALALSAPFAVPFGFSAAKDAIDAWAAHPIAAQASVRTASVRLSQ